MSVKAARRKRMALYCSITGLALLVAAISALSAREPDGLAIRTGMALITLGAAMWLPWQTLPLAVAAVWFAPNLGRSAADGYELFNLNMMLELPALLGIAGTAVSARMALQRLEQEQFMLGMNRELAGIDPETGVYEETQLRVSLEMELSRSRRFGHPFALVLVGVDGMRQRFDYRDGRVWQASFAATADLLRGTRANVDRVYRYGTSAFALILPESGPKEVKGLVRRLRRVARKTKPAEGEPGGPLPAHYGATFFPTCATTVDDLMRRAEIALRIAENNASRVQMDGAEATEMPPAETLRQPASADTDEAADETLTTVEPAAAATTLHLVESQVNRGDMQEQTPAGPHLSPDLRVLEVTGGSESGPQTAIVVDGVEEQAAREPETHQPAPTPLRLVQDEEASMPPAPDYSLDPEAVEVMDEPPIEVFAYRAPEPAVDVYNRDWQAEAPLSVLRRPQPRPHLAALGGDVQDQQPPVEDVVGDALKQLDGTLEMIRALKQRSA